MKKKIASKLTLGKRSVATLSEESMTQVNGGNYTQSGVTGGCGAGSGGNTMTWGPSTSIMCPRPTDNCVTFNHQFTCL
ncbi:class I lanthipeptide [Arcicella sp. DC2W]|uniref:Class I lanthipeptide n=1 Tax=Arcicella gelida TaxID=2984195 RepID=A0ABU5S392_9BACT|nr:class I lanthipeptide [Arcicella sp. DC2W]MEA5402902.1 class I lanthipeptide [Arcicella sp. DC2W]